MRLGVALEVALAAPARPRLADAAATRPPSWQLTLPVGRPRCQEHQPATARRRITGVQSLRSARRRSRLPSRPRSRRDAAARPLPGRLDGIGPRVRPGAATRLALPRAAGVRRDGGTLRGELRLGNEAGTRARRPAPPGGPLAGAAVAIAVAAREPGRVHRVTAFGPAGLPVEHGLRQAARDVVANGLGKRLGAAPPPARRCARSTIRAPPSAWPARSSASTSRASSASSEQRASSSWW